MGASLGIVMSTGVVVWMWHGVVAPGIRVHMLWGYGADHRGRLACTGVKLRIRVKLD
jgi:hypothetical protein